MFTVADEFDYAQVIAAQLEAVLAPLLDGRRGVHMNGGRVAITVDMPSDFGRLVAKLQVSCEVE